MTQARAPYYPFGMVADEIQAVLEAHVNKPGHSIKKLAKDADVFFESARRAVKGIGSPTVSTTNALLGATGHTLKIVRLDSETDDEPQASV